MRTSRGRQLLNILHVTISKVISPKRLKILKHKGPIKGNNMTTNVISIVSKLKLTQSVFSKIFQLNIMFSQNSFFNIKIIHIFEFLITLFIFYIILKNLNWAKSVDSVDYTLVKIQSYKLS